MGKIIEVGNVRAEPGEVKFGHLPGIQLADSTYANIPVMILNGTQDGPTLCLVATAHGVEVESIEVLRRVIREEISSDRLHGSLIAIPVSNPLAYVNHSYLTPAIYDSANAWSSFPGDRQGSATARLVKEISEVVCQSNFFIDCHCAPSQSMNFTMVNLDFGDNDTEKTAWKMAKAFGLSKVTDPIFYRGANTSLVVYYVLSFAVEDIVNSVAQCCSDLAMITVYLNILDSSIWKLIVGVV